MNFVSSSDDCDGKFMQIIVGEAEKPAVYQEITMFLQDFQILGQPCHFTKSLSTDSLTA